jgi:hypothetical protein
MVYSDSSLEVPLYGEILNILQNKWEHQNSWNLLESNPTTIFCESFHSNLCNSWWLNLGFKEHQQWPPSQDFCRGSHPVVGRIVHVSCWTVFLWRAAILAVTVGRCHLVRATWCRDDVWPDRGDRCPLGPYGVSAAFLLLSEQSRLAKLDLSPFLPGVGTVRGCGPLLRARLRQVGGVVANPGLSIWPSPLGLARPRSYGLSLADVSWATRPAN